MASRINSCVINHLNDEQVGMIMAMPFDVHLRGHSVECPRFDFNFLAVTEVDEQNKTPSQVNEIANIRVMSHNLCVKHSILVRPSRAGRLTINRSRTTIVSAICRFVRSSLCLAGTYPTNAR